MMQTELWFHPTGVVTGLYTELIPLAEVGILEVVRLTHIEFNVNTQCWEVLDRHHTVLFSGPSRSACLRWEHRTFSGQAPPALIA